MVIAQVYRPAAITIVAVLRQDAVGNDGKRCFIIGGRQFMNIFCHFRVAVQLEDEWRICRVNSRK
jgi:hypothetical protein